ncbi:MAG: DUF4013 domain-containing protein [Ardenticatenaceae bacterium]|nr:DUF4013 domain-containing protein [Ardenticatenaceae bacterium]
MDIRKAIVFVFQDPRWLVKIVIGDIMIFLSFLIVPVFFLQGYLIEIIRNVMRSEEHPLPEWNNWGARFKDGLNLTIAGLIYTLPLWLALCCSGVTFLPAAMSEGDLTEATTLLSVSGFSLIACLAFLFLVAYAVIAPAIAIQYAHEDTLAATLRFGEVFAIVREHLGDIVLAVVVITVLGVALSLLGLIPLIGWLFSVGIAIYVFFVTGHLYGQIGAKVGGLPDIIEKLPDDLM